MPSATFSTPGTGSCVSAEAIEMSATRMASTSLLPSPIKTTRRPIFLIPLYHVFLVKDMRELCHAIILDNSFRCITSTVKTRHQLFNPRPEVSRCNAALIPVRMDELHDTFVQLYLGEKVRNFVDRKRAQNADTPGK